MSVSSVKLRILYIMKILLEKTDETHVLSAADLSDRLKAYGMTADRKTVYSDIETLREYGLDIVQTKGTNGGYYIGERRFELPELKLLVDAVQASRFISRKKSGELIGKLEALCSEWQAKQLQRNVFIYNRPKTGNETIYYNVDQIHTAILENRQIAFHYGEWTVKKQLEFKKNGALYRVSPWALTWDNQNYYLIAYDKEADLIKHYRVDKIKDIAVQEEKRQGQISFRDFDLAAFAKKTFSMYGGQEENVTLLCRNSLAGVIIDRFGREAILAPVGEKSFKVSVPVVVSSQFFGWAAGVGREMRIEGPERVKNQYIEYLRGLLKACQDETGQEETGERDGKQKETDAEQGG